MGKIERGMLNGSGYEVWMHRREQEFCDEIEPVHVEIINGENVVWARRYGISESGFFDIHHIGCDCLGCVPKGESEIRAMLGCSALQQVLLTRADETARDIYHLDQILPHFLYLEGDDVYLDEQGEDIAANFVFEALVRTIEKPEECHGNIRSGTHVKPIVQRMLGGVAEAQVDELLGGLEFQGMIAHDDPFITIAA